MDWNEGLNENSPAYLFAVDDSSIIRVIAGPGTGKSFGLQKRIARLLTDGVKPEKIMAVTFTRTAAQDLKKEIANIGLKGSEKVVARTLHSFCFALLNKQSIIDSIRRYPRPLLEHEMCPMLYDLDEKYGDKRHKRKKIKDFEAMWAKLQSDTPDFNLSESDIEFEHDLMQWLTLHQAMLFGEMIRETYKYLKDNPRCYERNIFQHILVDEYQDLNKAEQLVIEYLASNSSLVVIGDDDQSIYSFKYAHPEGIREFSQTHDSCSCIDFIECRRCPKQVVRMAAKLIANNSKRTLGDLMPYENNANGDVNIIQFNTLQNEIQQLGEYVNLLVHTKAIKPSEILILVPRQKIGNRIRNEIIRKGINAKSYFKESALSTDEAKKIYSFFNLAARPSDLVAWRYLFGEGDNKYRKNVYKRILDYAIENKVGILSVLENIEQNKVKIPYTQSILLQYKKYRTELMNFINSTKENRQSIINIFKEDDDNNSDFREVIISAINEIGLMEDKDVSEWFEKIYSYIVEYISYPQSIEGDDHVRIMSLHSSKGLSSKVVIIMSCIDELLVNYDSEFNQDEIEEYIEEQRRLFYVAITRCKCYNDHPGTLVISSFVGLPGNEAKQLGILANSQWRRTRACRFISEFKESAPTTQPM